jgi:16S rRNA (uracil1498-N3)-methyltransferase
MHRPRLFVPAASIGPQTAVIDGIDHHHLSHVLRCRAGDRVVLLDNEGRAYCATVEEIGRLETRLRIDGIEAVAPEPAVRILLAQAIGKGDRTEQALQHGVETGISRFLPIASAHGAVDVPPERREQRLARWRLIAKGAAEQSERALVPEVEPIGSFRELIERRRSVCKGPALLLHPSADSTPLRDALPADAPEELLVAVGPEGGWQAAEVSAARAANLVPVSLGPHVLRTEIAALVAVSQILFHYNSHSPGIGLPRQAGPMKAGAQGDISIQTGDEDNELRS